MQWFSLILILPYLVFLTGIIRGLAKIRSFRPKSTPSVFISVIVACRNEEKNISRLLEHISAQDYSRDLFECIIIDDNSADSTFNTASAFTGIKNYKVLKNKGSGKKTAVRTGIEACTGGLIITTDADCIPGSAWLKTFALFYAEERPDLIIGPVTISGGKGFFSRFQELEFLSLQGITAGTAIRDNPVMCNAANMAFTKEAYIENHTGLHEELVSGDDVFLLHSLKKKKNSRILWLESDDAIVSTAPCETWNSFFRQRARWISKAGAYKDAYTIMLAIVTFVTILIQPLLLAAGFFDHIFWLVLATALVLKSIPDYLILRNTTSRYGRQNLMRWFVPSQLFYICYIFRVVLRAAFSENRW